MSLKSISLLSMFLQNFIEEREECQSWIFDKTLFSSTAVDALEMVCEDEWKKSTAQVIGLSSGQFRFITHKFSSQSTWLECSLEVSHLDGSQIRLAGSQHLWFLLSFCRLVGPFLLSSP